ncbi:MAG: hypothetical protein HKO63_10440 [Acidimicrobiia bacterium]|nr:hypothetical protein [Acidimicrobiia bacterium]MBT8192435.1 hypothetical protein [Acidimicrobiia bacterium]MBT8246678.1 hypothetical protein [Acidimicrobiia bacterium]NNF87297.1 hypothetical protein [Acidimicrobiia bacterium]NNJ48321.1 hypothetical protein [Acidimicrobiia bacterium]
MTRPLVSRNALIAGVVIVASIVALAFFTAPNPTAPDDDGDPWTGRWLINGQSAQDTEYSGSLTIRRTSNGYDLQWLVTGDIALGEGRVVGSRLEASWRSTSAISGEATGSAVYTVDADGSIIGSRTIDGVDGEGTEEGEPAG